MERFLKRWLPAILIMVAIFYFSSIPSKEMPNFGNWDAVVKKSGHILEYALLGLALLRGIHSRDWWGFSLALAGVILYAMSDEFHQSFIPGRTSTMVDVGIDTLGAFIGLAAARFSLWFQKRLFQTWIE